MNLIYKKQPGNQKWHGTLIMVKNLPEPILARKLIIMEDMTKAKKTVQFNSTMWCSALIQMANQVAKLVPIAALEQD